jgi:5'-deoxynucleotidase
MEERKAGNCEFVRAESSLREILRGMALPALNCFMEEFLPAYEEPLDGMM